MRPVSHVWHTPVRQDHLHGYVARLGELEEAPARGIPANRQPAARERDARPGARWTGRRMRSARRRSDDAGSHRLAGAEHLRMHATRSDPPGHQPGAHVAKERRRPAHVEAGVARDAELLEQGQPDVPGGVEVFAPVDPPTAVGCTRRIRDCRGGVARDPATRWRTDAPRRCASPYSHHTRRGGGLARERVQHREHGRHPDAGAEQDDRGARRVRA